MQMCFDCAKQEPDRHCLECKYFIQPGPLHRILSPPVQVILEGERFNQYPAQIIALNTKEFGLKTQAPVPGQYVIKLQENLWVEVARTSIH
ncbi:hypothetical protein SAMN05660649_00951 [Desulfotomaculum arcticum]|uniref:Uncharacterized protein n=1 Tax=Desulfotruncus arcticus DSM 17038 TaxID=1121424 RepID=A0A1I2PKM1_9FIRM|nr:hypothetical protein SAMN05660649_00951 [Desulfotomaculum arcticum] [Desulfotruncus arcticus DSM 17038]